MKVQFLKPHPEFGYFAGDNAEIQPERAQVLIKSGHVILFPGTTKTKADQAAEDKAAEEEKPSKK